MKNVMTIGELQKHLRGALLTGWVTKNSPVCIEQEDAEEFKCLMRQATHILEAYPEPGWQGHNPQEPGHVPALMLTVARGPG